jgi:hypothetical protein
MFYATDDKGVVLTRHSTMKGALGSVSKNKDAVHLYECFGRFEPGDKLAEAKRLHYTKGTKL